uniref:SOCS box domain-containing protein n=1 Tax=Knipowitschia caucasica TaxID=637954 RepID=A0AAV2JGW7_KNICA
MMMTKFRYKEYFSQFRNASGSCKVHPTQGERHRQDNLSDVTSEQQTDVDHLWAAIKKGDMHRVHDLATSCPLSLLYENKDGWMPLHYAAYCGQTECLKTLLKAHPDSVDKRTLQEQTALFLAVSCEHLSCVQCLLQSGADPDIGNKYKETPLFKACKLQNVDMVSLLLSYGATVNQRCSQEWTALLEAVAWGHIEICEMLLKAGALINPPNTYSISPLNVAANKGHLRALCFLITKGADVNMQTCDGFTALHEASKNGFREIVLTLLRKNADANKCCNSGLLPLHVAAQYGHHEIVSLLVPVTSRAMLRHSWISPLHLAAQHNRHSVAAVLLQTGAQVNVPLPHTHSVRFADHRLTPLYFAVANGSTETAELLLKAGANVNLDPVSPLLMAMKLGCIRSVNLLLHQGADKSSALSVTCNQMHERPIQFCEWLSSFVMSKWAVPMMDLLLEHVAQVQLCRKLTDILDSTEEWRAVKRKLSSPRPLMHLCRVKIRTQIQGQTQQSVARLPLPTRILSYLSMTC